MGTEQREPVAYLRAGVGCLVALVTTIGLAARELWTRLKESER